MSSVTIGFDRLMTFAIKSSNLVVLWWLLKIVLITVSRRPVKVFNTILSFAVRAVRAMSRKREGYICIREREKIIFVQHQEIWRLLLVYLLVESKHTRNLEKENKCIGRKERVMERSSDDFVGLMNSQLLDGIRTLMKPSTERRHFGQLLVVAKMCWAQLKHNGWPHTSVIFSRACKNPALSRSRQTGHSPSQTEPVKKFNIVNG